jgi:hypothetical protein
MKHTARAQAETYSNAMVRIDSVLLNNAERTHNGSFGAVVTLVQSWPRRAYNTMVNTGGTSFSRGLYSPSVTMENFPEIDVLAVIEPKAYIVLVNQCFN